MEKRGIEKLLCELNRKGAEMVDKNRGNQFFEVGERVIYTGKYGEEYIGEVVISDSQLQFFMPECYKVAICVDSITVFCAINAKHLKKLEPEYERWQTKFWNGMANLLKRKSNENQR